MTENYRVSTGDSQLPSSHSFWFFLYPSNGESNQYED